jgi:hypothetical protein
VPLEEGEPHALTIERRSEGYRVHNRTERLLTLDDQPLEPGSARPWPLGTALWLTPEVTLRLAPCSEVSEPGSSCPAVVDGASGRAPRPRADRSPRTVSPAAVIPLLLLALAAWLSTGFFPSGAPAEVKVETDRFATLILDLHRLGFEGRYTAGELQRAQQERELGKEQPARERLFRLRDWVLRHRTRSGGFAARLQIFETVLEWIAARV